MKRRGFTLIESILVLVVISAILLALAPYIRTIHTTWLYGDRKTEMLQHGRISLDKMIRIIRSAQGITHIDSSGQGTYIGLKAQDGSYVIFFHNIPGSPYYIGESGNIKNNDLVMQTEDRKGNPVNSLLAKSLENITFTYLKDTMETGNPATQPEDAKAVNIDMRLSDPEGIVSDTLPVSSLAFCRALGKGIVWVADTNSNEIVKINHNGVELKRISGFSSPNSVSIDPTDGSLWVADTNNNEIVKLDADGTGLVRTGGFKRPNSVSVNSADGSCWVADTNNDEVVKLNSSGTELVRVGDFRRPNSVSVNSDDGSCWVADTGNDRVVKLRADGELLVEVGPEPGGGKGKGGGKVKSVFKAPLSVSVNPNPTDGSCWVADTNNDQVVKLDSTGTELERVSGFRRPNSVSVNPTDGSCWVADTNNDQVVKLDSTGTELARVGGFGRPDSVSVNPNDGTCWVAASNLVVRLDYDGTELLRVNSIKSPSSVAPDPGDR